MNLPEKATIIHFHRHRITAFNDGSIGALGWKEKESQLKRFEVIASIADYDHCSLLDVGCGYGGFKAYLDQHFSDFTYIGIDLMPEFIHRCKELYSDFKNTYFFQADFTTAGLPSVDYVITSGALGYRSADPDFYFRMIEKLYGASDKALVFNMLDTTFFPQHPLLVGYNPEQVLAFCKTLSHRVSIITGYLKDDFTIVMFKG